MRSYSLLAIVLLCLIIIVVDVFAFIWLQSIIHHLNSELLVNSINIMFWLFTFGLVMAILVLKLKMDAISLKRRQLLISSLYGLTISSFIPKIIFVLVISILYFTNYVFSASASLIIVPIFGLFSGFLPFFVIVYAVFRSLYRFKIHEVTITTESLPENFDGLKVVHISDLHLGSFNYRYSILERAVQLINSIDADLIFFTGDLVNNFAWELNGWEPVLRQLSAKKGKYAVLGNHDYGDYSTWESLDEKQANLEAIKDFYKNTDFKLLLNESDLIQDGDDTIAIIGVENWGKPPFKQYGDLQVALTDVISIRYKLLLSHDPSHWDQEVINDTDIAITFSGHTHGMQAGIQFRGAQWSPIKYKYKRWAGLYKYNSQYLYVTRGLGWLGFPGRLGMRPEITYIKLKKSTR
jgi:predicted MPP superfamily phosphohydrolase